MATEQAKQDEKIVREMKDTVYEANVLFDFAKNKELTKQEIREKVWEYLQAENIADKPFPLTNRIPNFKTSTIACEELANLEVFKNAKVIKVNPDKPQKNIRFLTLKEHKMLLVPSPAMKKSLFCQIDPPKDASKKMLRTCSSSLGTKLHSKPLEIDCNIKLDVFVVGSVAVSPNGVRIGRGKGLADIEYAMLRRAGAITNDTKIVTVVHESQVIDLPETLCQPHDFMVDLIVTPSQVIQVPPKANEMRRSGPIIDWGILTVEKYQALTYLKQFRQEDKENGMNVKLVDEGEVDADEMPIIHKPHIRVRKVNAENKENDDRLKRRVFRRPRNIKKGDEKPKKSIKRFSNQRRLRQRTHGGSEGEDENNSGNEHKSSSKPPMYAIWLGKIAKNVRVSELKSKVKGCGVQPIHIVWRPQSHSAFILMLDATETTEAVNKLGSLDVNGCKPIVEMSRKTKLRLEDENNGAKIEIPA